MKKEKTKQIVFSRIEKSHAFFVRHSLPNILRSRDHPGFQTPNGVSMGSPYASFGMSSFAPSSPVACGFIKISGTEKERNKTDSVFQN